MGRRKKHPAVRLAEKNAPPAIQPTAIYRIQELPRLLRVGLGTVRAEMREGRLRFEVKATKKLFLGQWLIDWLTAAAPRQQQQQQQEPTSPGPSM